MKNHVAYLLLSALLCNVLLSCASNEKPAQQLNEPAKKTPVYPDKFATIDQMIEDGNDFSVETGTYKLISNIPLHIQVSAQVNDGDLQHITKQNTIKALVYVTYSVFARTNVDSLTVTSIPIRINSADPGKRGNYIDNYRISHTINREKAREVMNKYIGTTNFDELLGAEDNGQVNMSLNSLKFDQLKSETGWVVNKVYDDLIK